MAAWRYWRIHVTASAGGTGLDWSEVTMDISGVDQTDPTDAAAGAATASSSYNATLLPPNAFDDSTSSRWASDFTNTWPQWLMYDFGAGNEKALDRITIRPALPANRAPGTFTFQCSNDNISWVTAHSETGLTTGWTIGVAREFSFVSPEPPEPGPTEHPALVSQGAVLVLGGTPSGAKVFQGAILALGRIKGRRSIGITN